MLIPSSIIHIVEDSESEVNGKENHVNWNKENNKERKTVEKKAQRKRKIWSKRPTPNEKQQPDLHADIIQSSPKHHTPTDVFSAVTNRYTKPLIMQSNLYAQQNGRVFQTNEKEIKAFLESAMWWLLINYQVSQVAGNGGSAVVNRV